MLSCAAATVLLIHACNASAGAVYLLTLLPLHCCVSCLPCVPQDVSGAMQPKLRAAFSLLHLNALRVTRPAINATFSTLKRRLLSVDPWLPVDTQVRTCGSKGKELAAHQTCECCLGIHGCGGKVPA